MNGVRWHPPKLSLDLGTVHCIPSIVALAIFYVVNQCLGIASGPAGEAIYNLAYEGDDVFVGQISIATNVSLTRPPACQHLPQGITVVRRGANHAHSGRHHRLEWVVCEVRCESPWV
jgi:hypothetical protein